VVASCPIIESYGLTECGAMAFFTSIDDPVTGHEGGPACNIEFKLVDVPEMGFLTDNKDERGNTMPKGELCIRGPGCMVSYYKDPELNKQTIDSQGFIHTGDIVALLNNGAIKVLERKKNFLKLSTGGYISPEKLENVYGRVTGIMEVYVHGDEKRDYLIAVVVPHKEHVEIQANKFAIPGIMEDWCKHKDIIKYYLDNMKDIAVKEGLPPLEIINNIIIDPVSLVTSGCCTPSYKIKRVEARIHYRKQIEELYNSKSE
jgi:long-chain acyl-CoA synthetase